MILTVVDVAGLCVMTIPSRWLDLDQPVLTKIELRDYSTSIVGLTLLVIRTEYIHDVRYRSTIEGLPLYSPFITPLMLPPLFSFSSLLCFLFFFFLTIALFPAIVIFKNMPVILYCVAAQRCHTSDFFK